MKKLIKYLILIVLIIVPSFNVKADSGSISIYASSKSVKVGNSTTVTIYCNSSVAMGTCEYSLSYDTKKLKLTSGNEDILEVVANNSTKQIKKTFTFKVIATGSSKVTVKSYAIRRFSDEGELATTISPVTITGISATTSDTTTYSTNNNLKSLSVDGHQLSPTFNKNTTAYTLNLDSKVESINIKAAKEDSTASISGAGSIGLSEGENRIDITVTSQKGTKKVYTIIATVKDANPIEIIIDNKSYTVIKRESILTKPENYEATTIIINDVEVPALYNDITEYTLVGLKDPEGIINLYIYNKSTNSYSLYKELSFNKIKLLLLTPDKPYDNYIKSLITIGDDQITGYKYNNNSKYVLIYGINLETGKTNWYQYEDEENTVQVYNDELNEAYNNKVDQLNKIIYVMAGVIGFLAILIIIVCSIKNNKTKKLKNKKNKQVKEKKALDKTLEKL